MDAPTFTLKLFMARCKFTRYTATPAYSYITLDSN